MGLNGLHVVTWGRGGRQMWTEGAEGQSKTVAMFQTDLPGPAVCWRRGGGHIEDSPAPAPTHRGTHTPHRMEDSLK